MRDSWLRWPFSGGAGLRDSVPDSLPGVGRRIKAISMASYYGAEYTNTPAGRFNTHTIRSRIIIVSFDSDAVLDSTVSITRWYAPSLGVEVRRTTDIYAGSTTPHGRIARELTAYTLQ